MADVAEIAGRLTDAQQRYVVACSDVPRDACFIAYDAALPGQFESGSPFAMFAKGRPDLIERVSGWKHALLWQYRLTPLGLALRDHLQSAQKGRAR